MGAKNLKAIAVRAAAKVATADPGAVLAAARDLRERSFGPATAKYRELGTLANLLTFNAISALPTRNFQAATFDGAEELAGPTGGNVAGDVPGDVQGMRRVARSSCASCTIGCEHIYRSRGGKQARVEYENVFALGPMCGVSDPDAVLAASARCDELGIDTISAGGTIACRGSGSATLPRCCASSTRSATAARRSVRCWRRDQDEHPERSGLTPRRSPRTSRAWRCRGMSLARSTRWRWAWR